MPAKKSSSFNLQISTMVGRLSLKGIASFVGSGAFFVTTTTEFHVENFFVIAFGDSRGIPTFPPLNVIYNAGYVRSSNGQFLFEMRS